MSQRNTFRTMELLLAEMETKTRHVRNAEFWGAPVGTPLPLPAGVGHHHGNAPRKPAQAPHAHRTAQPPAHAGALRNRPTFDKNKPETLFLGEEAESEEVFDALPKGTVITIRRTSDNHLRYAKGNDGWKISRKIDGIWSPSTPLSSTQVQNTVLDELRGLYTDSKIPTITLPRRKEVPFAGSVKQPPGVSKAEWDKYLTSYEARSTVALNWQRSIKNSYGSPELDGRTVRNMPQGSVISLNTFRIDKDTEVTDLEFYKHGGKWFAQNQKGKEINLPPLTNDSMYELVEYSTDIHNLKEITGRRRSSLPPIEVASYRYAEPGFRLYQPDVPKGESGQRKEEILTAMAMDELPIGSRVVVTSEHSVLDYSKDKTGSWIVNLAEYAGEDDLYESSSDEIINEIDKARHSRGDVEILVGSLNGYRLSLSADYEYDRDGYDKQGYNIEGYDRTGYDRNGYDEEGMTRRENQRIGGSQGVLGLDPKYLPSRNTKKDWGARISEIDAAAKLPTIKQIVETSQAGGNWKEQIGQVYEYTSESGDHVRVDGVWLDTFGGPNGETLVTVSGKIEDKRNGDIGWCKRAFMYSDGELVADNQYLRIDPHHQGRGFASEYNRHMENWYIANGFSAVEVDADIDVGGYAWARDGFDWNTDREGRNSTGYTISTILYQIEIENQDFEDMEGFDYPAVEKEIAKWKTVVTKYRDGNGRKSSLPTPFELSNIGWHEGMDNWPGRAGMLGTSWQGIKVLDPKARTTQRIRKLVEQGKAKSKVKGKGGKPTPQNSHVNRTGNRRTSSGRMVARPAARRSSVNRGN